MKIEKRLIHALPLAAIVGLSGLAFVGGSIQANEKSAKAESDGLSMTISGDFEFELTPEVGGTYAEKTVNVSVSTTNQTGYTLTFGAKDSTNAETDDGEGIIASIDDAYKSRTMPLNSWGFYVGTDDYLYPIPEKNRLAIIASSNNPSVNDITDVTIGVKVDPTLKSGDYKSTLVFTAFANENNCEEGFYCIDTLQEMTPAVCDATTTPLASATDVTYEFTTDDTKIPRTVLRDTRDGKTYLVSKYADGQCWMSQNLALDLSTTKTLTSANTDLNTISSWTPTNNTATSINGFMGDVTEDHSIKSNVPYLTYGGYASDAPSTNDGKSEWESVGNYYNWIAATAGINFDDMEDGSLAPNSICPKGWRLPTRRIIPSAGEQSDFGDLSNAYYDNDMYPFTERLSFVGARNIWVSDDGTEAEYPDLHSSYSGEGLYWTNVVDKAEYYKTVIIARIGYSDIYNTNEYYRSGVNVRCVARS